MDKKYSLICFLLMSSLMIAMDNSDQVYSDVDSDDEITVRPSELNALLEELKVLTLNNPNDIKSMFDAVRLGQNVKVKQLIDINPRFILARDEKGCTPLHYIAGQGDVNVLKMLINMAESNQDLGRVLMNVGDVQNHDGITPLYIAVSKYHFEIARMLLEDLFVDPNIADVKGNTPLHAASSCNHNDMVQLLIANGAFLSVKNNPLGFTPLHNAAIVGNTEIIKLLLKHGSYVDQRCEIKGRTPLCWAVELQMPNRFETALILLKNGADINAVDKDNKTAHDYAESSQNQELIKLLENWPNYKSYCERTYNKINQMPSKSEWPEHSLNEIITIAQGEKNKMEIEQKRPEKKINYKARIVGDSLLNKYDPIGYVLKKSNGNRIKLNTHNVNATKLIQYLLYAGAEVRRVLNYCKSFSDHHGLLNNKFFYRGESLNDIPIPQEIDIAAVTRGGFLEKLGKPAIDKTLMGDFGKLPDETMAKIAKKLDTNSLLKFIYSNKTMSVSLLNNEYYHFPPEAMNRHLLNMRPWHLVKCENVKNADELVNMVKELPCKYYHHGIAIDFSGFKEKIDEELVKKLRDFPVVSVHFAKNKFPQGLACLKDLTQLRELFVRNCKIETFPQLLCRLKELVVLDLGHNQLESLPDEISKLSRLCFLNLSNNRIKSLNSGLCALPSLRMLIVSNNLLAELPNYISLLKTLRILNVGNLASKENLNRLKELPTSIGQMQNLKRLMINRCGIETLPSSIGNLKNLEALYCDGNKLKKLPDEIGLLDNLEVLSLRGNMLINFSESLSGLSNMQELNLADNKLKNLPEKLILSLKNLKTLDVRGQNLDLSHDFKSQLKKYLLTGMEFKSDLNLFSLNNFDRPANKRKFQSLQDSSSQSPMDIDTGRQAKKRKT